MIFNKKVLKIFSLLLLFLFCFLTQAQAQEHKKICILPFDVHASVEGGALQESVYKSLVSEFEREKKFILIPPGDFAK